MLQVEATQDRAERHSAPSAVEWRRGGQPGMRHVHVGALSAAANVHIFICIWRGVVVWLLLATCASGQPGKRCQAGKGRRIAGVRSAKESEQTGGKEVIETETWKGG